jgi:DNA repair exonuclease SbcCD ATPase subunit
MDPKAGKEGNQDPKAGDPPANDPKPGDPPATDPKPGDMIPRERFNEVLTKLHALEAKQKEREDAEAEAERKRLEEQGQYKTLAEQAEAKRQEAEAELTRLREEAKVAKESAEKERGRVMKALTARLEKLPEAMRELAPQTEDPDALEGWLEKAEKNAGVLAGKPGSPDSPKPAGKPNEADEKRSREQHARRLAHSF